MSTVYDVIGVIGSFVISAGLVPQLYKVFTTKSANDISYSFLGMYNSGLGLLVIYGYGESLWPIYLPCSLELVGAIALLTMKIMYSKNATADDAEVGKLAAGDMPSTPTSARYFPALTPKNN